MAIATETPAERLRRAALRHETGRKKVARLSIELHVMGDDGTMNALVMMEEAVKLTCKVKGDGVRTCMGNQVREGGREGRKRV